MSKIKTRMLLGERVVSVALKLTLAEYNHMIARGAFDGLRRRVELIRGELREMNPAGPAHDDIISIPDSLER